MRPSEIVAWFPDYWGACKLAFGPTAHAVRSRPSLLLHPQELSHFFFARVWDVWGPQIDLNSRENKRLLISANAYGVVLDIGAGHGHTIDYLDRQRVTKYVAVEPNVLMHQKIRDTAVNAGYDEADETLLILSYGIEELDKITEALGGDHQVDTLVSVLTLCSIPDPQAIIPAMVDRLIKPNGGQLLFHEHVQSPREDAQWWQAVWSPVWGLAFDGCKLGRPTHLWIEAVGGWDAKESSTWGLEGESEVSLFWHRTGRMVREKAPVLI